MVLNKVPFSLNRMEVKSNFHSEGPEPIKLAAAKGNRWLTHRKELVYFTEAQNS